MGRKEKQEDNYIKIDFSVANLVLLLLDLFNEGYVHIIHMYCGAYSTV